MRHSCRTLALFSALIITFTTFTTFTACSDSSIEARPDSSTGDLAVAGDSRVEADSSANDLAVAEDSHAEADSSANDLAAAEDSRAEADGSAGDLAVTEAGGDGASVATDQAVQDWGTADSTVAPNPCTGTTYHVAESGSDSANGLTPATAWGTMGKVNGASFSPGDCILFKRGDTWNAQLMISSSGSATGGPITFGAYGAGDRPVIDGAGVALPQNHGLIRGSSKSFIVIENISVRNAGIGQAKENTGIGFFGGAHITVRSCEVRNTESAGLKFNTSSNVTIDGNEVSEACQDSWSETISLSGVDTFEVRNNVVHDNGSPGFGGSGIDVKDGSHDGTVHHNRVYSIAGSPAIYLDAYSKHTYNIEVYANYLYDNSGPGIMIGSENGGLLENISVHHNVVRHTLRGGLTFHDVYSASGAVRNVRIYNNTFYQNGSGGVPYYGGVRVWDPLIEELVIKNNIIGESHNFQVGIHDTTGPAPSQYTIDHNVIYGDQNSTGNFTAVDGSNAIKADPSFVDAAAHNFHLRPDSPAKNACDSSVWQGVPNIKDYDGAPITNGNGAIVTSGGHVSCGAFQ